MVRASIAAILAGESDGWHAETGLAQRADTRLSIAVSLLSSEPEPVFAAQLLDVTAEHHARVRIEAAEKLTSATLDTTPCIILVTDLAGTVIRVNAAATRLTGFTEDELVGQPAWTHLALPQRRHLVPDLIRDGALLSEASWEIDVGTKHGDPLRMVWNSKTVPDDDGDPAYVVLTGIDVTAERNAAGLVTHLLQASITTALVGIDALRPDHALQLRRPAAARPRRRRPDRDAVHRPPRPRGAGRRTPPAQPSRAASRRWSPTSVRTARASPATGPGSAATAAGTPSR